MSENQNHTPSYYKEMIPAQPDTVTEPIFYSLKSNVKATLNSWLKFGTVFLIYRLCMYYFTERDCTDTELFDPASLQLVLFILLGFALYFLVVHPFIPVHLQHPILENIANDTLMFGTVLVSSHLMESYMCDESYFDAEWLKTAGLILLSFAAYRVFADPFIPFDKLNPTVRPIVQDWAQYGIFLVVFRLLRGKSILDQKWILSVLFVLLGFTGYHLITKRLIYVN